MNNSVTDSERAPEPVGPYPHARRAGDFIFLSGVGPQITRYEGDSGGHPLS